MGYIPLTRGLTVVVDDDDIPAMLEHNWMAKPASGGSCFYAVAREGGRTVYMHRLLMNAQAGQIIDHADRDGLNNRRSNLRFATHLQNSGNRVWQRKNTPYKGVHFDKTVGRYVASCGSRSGKTYWRKGFADPVEAARAYDERAAVLFGEFAVLNFPPGHNRNIA